MTEQSSIPGRGKKTVGQRAVDFFKNASLIAAAYAAPAALAPEKAHAQDRAPTAITIEDQNGVPDLDAYISLNLESGAQTHRAGVEAAANLTRLADIETLNIRRRFPVIVTGREGMRWNRGRVDERFWEQSISLRAGYDSQADFEGPTRFTITPELAYAQRRDFDDSPTLRESFLGVGGRGSLTLPVGDGLLRFSGNGQLIVPVSGEYRGRDANGDRRELDLSGYTLSLDALYTRQMPEGLSSLVGIDPKNWGIIARAGVTLADITRTASAQSVNDGVLEIDTTNNSQTIRFELGPYWRRNNLLPDSLDARFGSLTLTGDYTMSETEVEPLGSARNFFSPTSEDDSTFRLGLRARQQFGDNHYLGIGVIVDQDGKPLGTFNYSLTW